MSPGAAAAARRCPALRSPLPGGGSARRIFPRRFFFFAVTSQRAAAASREVLGGRSWFCLGLRSGGLGNCLWEKASGCESLWGARLAGCGRRGGQRGPRPEHRQGMGECFLLSHFFSQQAAFVLPCKGSPAGQGEMQKGVSAFPLQHSSCAPGCGFGGDFASCCPGEPALLPPLTAGWLLHWGKLRHRVVQGQEGDSSRE